MFGIADHDKGMMPSKLTKAMDPWIRGAGTWTFTAPEAGRYSIYLWGAGGTGANGLYPNGSYHASGGGAGGALKKSVRFANGQQLSITVGFRALWSGASASASTCTLADGTVLTAGAGANGQAQNSPEPQAAGGVATGGDINLTGGNGRSYAALTGDTGQGAEPGTPGSRAAATNIAGGGGSAPGFPGFRGGNGGNAGWFNTSTWAKPGTQPGGGGGALGGSSGSFDQPRACGGDGQVTIVYEGE